MMSEHRSYYRVMAGPGSAQADLCRHNGFIGGDWGVQRDLSGFLPDTVREFNDIQVPIFIDENPGRSKVAAGLCCGMLYTISKGIKVGDIVITPDGDGNYYVGKVKSEYFYQSGEVLPHRRGVEWSEKKVRRSDMSDELKKSTGSIGTVANVSKHAEEIISLVPGFLVDSYSDDISSEENVLSFAFERYLEEFLISNWSATKLADNYNIYTVDEEIIGKQFPVDTGFIDILAISKDESELLVIELKRGRASDATLGQIQRYMGYVKDELCESHQSVRGVIIALEDDLRLRRALSVTNDIEFYRYRVDFELLQP